MAEYDSQTSTVTPAHPAGEMSEGQAWNALLGLDGFDSFPNDGSLDGFSFLGSSAADTFSLTAMDFSMPTETHNHNQTLHTAADVNIHPALSGTTPWIPRSPTTELHGSVPQPWPPPLPSMGPEVPPLSIPDTVISSLRGSLDEDDRQTPTPAALRLFLASYFDVFNVHLPLFHEPSFDFEGQPLGLLLAMAAVGALYRLERRAVTLLYRAADAAAPVGASLVKIGSFHRRSSCGPSTEPSAPGKWQSLAYYQTRLLLQYVGILGGDSDLAERSLGMIAELSLTVRRLGMSLVRF